MLCYLDEFVGIKSTQQRAQDAFHRFNILADALGLALARDKCFPPSTNLTWLGFTIDTISMTVSIPQGKAAILADCLEWKHKSRATRKQLQSLAGKHKTSQALY